MKKHFITAFGALCLAAIATTASAQSFNDILGRTLSNENGTVVIAANGRLTGQFGDRALEGRWWANDQGHFCRTGTFGGDTLPERCQTISMRSGQITFTDVGGSRTVTYSIN